MQRDVLNGDGSYEGPQTIGRAGRGMVRWTKGVCTGSGVFAGKYFRHSREGKRESELVCIS